MESSGSIKSFEKDKIILLIMMTLIGFGLVMIYSASAIIAMESHGDSFYFLKKQIIWVLIGGVFMFIASNIDLDILKESSMYLILISIIMLVLVSIPGIGPEINHARRWFRFGPISFQPSEFTKLTVIIYLSSFLSRKGKKIQNLGKGFFPPLIIVGIITLLILIEPDLGTAFLIGLASIIILYLGGAKLAHILPLFFISLPASIMVILSMTHGRQRLIAFLNPWKYSTTSGYQIIQSLLSFGKGGFWGAGIGEGKQKLFFLPEAHTDFIFAVIGEEMGFIGSVFLIFLFMCLLWRCYRLIERHRDTFEGYMATGIFVFIFTQTVINLFVATGIFPTKGLPLPFLSFGGSSLVTSMIMIGILFSISKRSHVTTQVEESMLYKRKRLRSNTNLILSQVCILELLKRIQRVKGSRGQVKKIRFQSWGRRYKI